ncbi:hypothetical protein [Reyranella sp.]|uniref:hypothetical protein n=1 Tax=Reyranella sp. TaxID=1929291 RepID=UPI004037472E
MPTVIVGSALDIVEYCGVPRFLFTDFPLGNPCGPPWRQDLQRMIARQALDLLRDAGAARTTRRSDVSWPSDDEWRPRYGRVKPEDVERLRALGEERRRQQVQARKPG